MSHYQDFSSWQPEQERHFVVFEQRTVESAKRAWTVAAVAGIGFFILVVGVVLSFKPEKSSSEAAAEEVGQDLPAESPSSATPAPAPTPAPAATPDPAAPAATDPAAGTAPAEGSAPTEAPAGAAPAPGTVPAAPPPPKGATKAPPTALPGIKK